MSKSHNSEVIFKGLLCPICQKEVIKISSINFSSSLDDYIITHQCTKHTSLPKQISLQKLILSFNISRYCPYHEFTPSPFYCSLCKESFCTECYWDHILTEEKACIKDNNPITFCTFHQKKLENYCSTCHEYMCQTCSYTRHKGHNPCIHLLGDWEEINECTNNNMRDIKIFVEQTNQVISELMQKLQKFQTVVNSAYNEYLKVRLPWINLYKTFVFNSMSYPTSEMNKIINAFDFEKNMKSYTYSFIKNEKGNNTEKKSDENAFDINRNKIKSYLHDIINNINKAIKKTDWIFTINTYPFDPIYVSNHPLYSNNNRVSPTAIVNENKKRTCQNKDLLRHKATKPITHKIKSFTDHTGSVYKLLKLSDGKFASSSADGTVIIWDNYLLSLNVIWHAHSSSINNIIEYIDEIKKIHYWISCSNDNSVKIFYLEGLNIVKTIRFDAPVISWYNTKDTKDTNNRNYLIVYCNNAVSFVSMTTFEKGKSYEIFFGISVLEQIYETQFIAALENSELSIHFTNDDISIISVVNWKYACCGDYGGNVFVVDTQGGDVVHSMMKVHKYVINALIMLKDGTVCTGSNDKCIKIIDWFKRGCVITVIDNAHDGAVRSLVQLNDGRIVSGSSDDVISIWG